LLATDIKEKKNTIKNTLSDNLMIDPH